MPLEQHAAELFAAYERIDELEAALKRVMDRLDGFLVKEPQHWLDVFETIDSALDQRVAA